jgi:hypothetical protein
LDDASKLIGQQLNDSARQMLANSTMTSAKDVIAYATHPQAQRRLVACDL